jgi:pimeloyl-ACP methyl ester carboxylesterase
MNIRILILSALIFLFLNCRLKTENASTMNGSTDTAGYASVNGLKMYYEIHGSGKPLVLIHGGGSTIQTTFGKVLAMFAKNHKVIAVELQAHGHTADRDTPESFEQDADDVATLLRYLKIDKADILGFSNGGNTTMRIGTRHADQVNKLVIVSAFYKREGMVKGFFEGMQHATLDNMPAHLQKAYLQIGDSAGLKRMFEQDKNRMLNFKDWNDSDLTSIKAPSLIILGDRDVSTTQHAVEMSKKIPDCRLMILPGNHGSFMGEGESRKDDSRIPDFFVATVEEFLQDRIKY